MRGRTPRNANAALASHQFTLRVESGELAYGGWTFKTNGVATPKEIDVLRGAIIDSCPKDTPAPWVGLPQLTSYLKIRSAPYFRDVSTETRTVPSDIIQAFSRSVYGSFWKPTGPARIDRESNASTRATVYFNIWDSTSGTNTRALIGTFLFSVKRARFLPLPPAPVAPSARTVGGGATLLKGARCVEDLTGRPNIVFVAGCARGM